MSAKTGVPTAVISLCSSTPEPYHHSPAHPDRSHPSDTFTSIPFMLKNHGPLHTPDLLYALASMGHGDDLAIVDAHFPADSMAQRLIRLDGANATDTLRACLELIPLDTFVPDPALRMRVVDNPEEVRPIQHEFQQIVNEAEGREIPLKAIDRFGFYERAKAAYAIVLTGELRTYGCVLVKKGVVQ